MGFSFFLKRRKKRLFSATRRMSRRADRYRADLLRFLNARDAIDGTV
jgi:hypothetical protein